MNLQSGQPIYEQLYRKVVQMAALGVLEKGSSLPSVRAVAQELGVNPNTVQKAYTMLERDGILCTVPGKGSFLAGDTEALQKRKALVAQRLSEAAKEAAECGMTREEILAAVGGTWKERHSDD